MADRNQSQHEEPETIMIICPYCHAEVSASAVEVEDGCCPECGAIVTASAITAIGREEPVEVEDAEEPADEHELIDEDDEL